jgi:hypothetical protein
MNILTVSLLAVVMMGLIIPSALGEMYLDEGYYPFSIEYPSEWDIILKENVSVGVIAMGDDEGRNGMFITLFIDSVESGVADYEIWETLKGISKDLCYSMTDTQSFATCSHYKITDSRVHYVDGYKTFTVFEDYRISLSGNDPLVSNDVKEDFDAKGTYSVVFVGDDIWEIATNWKSDNYEESKALDIIESFKLKDVEPQTVSEIQEIWWLDGIINFFKSLFS